VNIPQNELDEWERTAVFVNGQLNKATGAIGRSDLAGARQHIEAAGERNWTARRAMLRCGAANSIQETAARVRAQAGLPDRDAVPLELLSSPANRRYARALREAYEALQAVETERGWDSDLSAKLYETLAAVELEVYGPAYTLPATGRVDSGLGGILRTGFRAKSAKREPTGFKTNLICRLLIALQQLSLVCGACRARNGHIRGRVRP
jgi:hypothetical protein